MVAQVPNPAKVIKDAQALELPTQTTPNIGDGRITGIIPNYN
jgi:hypothetical protein